MASSVLDTGLAFLDISREINPSMDPPRANLGVTSFGFCGLSREERALCLDFLLLIISCLCCLSNSAGDIDCISTFLSPEQSAKPSIVQLKQWKCRKLLVQRVHQWRTNLFLWGFLSLLDASQNSGTQQ